MESHSNLGCDMGCSQSRNDREKGYSSNLLRIAKEKMTSNSRNTLLQRAAAGLRGMVIKQSIGC